MRVHCLDVLILLLALVGVMTVSILVFSSPDTSSKKYPVSCWTPNQFSSSWIEYSNSYCTTVLKQGDAYKAFLDDGIPRVEPRNNTKIVTEDELKEEPKLPRLLLAETLVAVLTFAVQYMVITVIFSMTHGERTKDEDISLDSGEKASIGRGAGSKSRGVKSLSGSSTVTIIYCFVLFAAVVAWFVLAGLSHNEMKNKTVDINTKTAEEVSRRGVFMCDMRVRRLGNIQRYTIQCVVNPGDSFDNWGKEINTALCFTIAFLLLVHLLYTLVVSPLVNNRIMGKDGKKPFISDLNLALSVGAV